MQAGPAKFKLRGEIPWRKIIRAKLAGEIGWLAKLSRVHFFIMPEEHGLSVLLVRLSEVPGPDILLQEPG